MEFSHPRLEKLTVVGPTDLSCESRVVIALHGTGGSPHALVKWIGRALRRSGVTIIAPDAKTVGRTKGWWHSRKSYAMRADDPEFLSAIDMLTQLYRHVLDQGVRPENIVILGQSQGACLALSWAVAAAGDVPPPGLVMAMSGSLLMFPRKVDLAGWRFALSVHEIDRLVPSWLVSLSASALRGQGADVGPPRIQPGKGHNIKDMLEDADTLRSALGV